MKNRIEKLKEIMQAKGLTQEQLAREIGVTVRTVVRWLHGDSEPKGLSIIAIDEFISKNQ